MRPQSRGLVFYLGKFHSELTRAASLDQFDKLVDSKLRIYFTQQVDMIGHNFNNIGHRLCCNLINDVFQSVSNFITQNRPAIFWAPYNMIFI